MDSAVDIIAELLRKIEGIALPWLWLDPPGWEYEEGVGFLVFRFRVPVFQPFFSECFSALHMQADDAGFDFS